MKPSPNVPARRLRYWLKAILSTVALVAAGSLLVLFVVKSHRDAGVRRIVGGSKGTSILRRPDRAQAYRIGKLADGIEWGDAVVGDYTITAGPISVSSPQGKSLAKTFLDPTTYVWDSAKACIPSPGIRLDFSRGDDRLQVLLCFECDIVLYYLNGKPVGGEDFNNARPELVRQVRSLFPKDPVIQSLSENH